MKAPQPNEYADQDLAGWLASEKIDGFRCIWNGTQFLSRSGVPFAAPAEWVAAMPPVGLDGELFAEDWSSTCAAVKSGNWSALRFHVFDIAAPGDLQTRLDAMPDLPSFCEVIEHRLLFSTEHANQLMQSIVANGGEGIVCRRPDTQYNFCDMVKLKPLEDQECTILEPVFTTYKTIPGSYRCQLNGVEFRMPAHNKRFETGDLVTFYHRGMQANGKPRQPKPKGIRAD